MLAPGAAMISRIQFLETVDRQPAGSLNLALQDEELQHALVRAEHTLERVSAQVFGERGHGRRVLNLEEGVVAVL